MLLGILSTFLGSLRSVIDKKSIGIPNVLSPYMFTFLSWGSSIFIIAYLILIGNKEFLLVNILYLALACTIAFLWIIHNNIVQYVYKNEKISVITPYTNLNKVITIILSFFIFGDVSLFSVLIALFIVSLIIVVSVDIRNIIIPKTIGLFLVSELIISFNILVIGYILLHISAINYFIIINTISIFLLLFIVICNKDIFKLYKNPLSYYKYRFIAGSLGNIASIISLFIVASQGVVVSILYSFIYLFFIIVLSSLYLRESPDKKAIFLSISIIILVTLGIFLK